MEVCKLGKSGDKLLSLETEVNKENIKCADSGRSGI